MYKMDEDLKEDMPNCDYFSAFIKSAIRELKTNGICYVFHRYQVDEILKYMKVTIDVRENDCGYTLSIPRNKRKYNVEV